jgi:sigma-B regulation protein RsbU (phosphoserine phosphatase)
MQILVADDQVGVLDAARLVLKSNGHTAVTVGSPRAVLEQVASHDFDLILMDLNYARDTTSGQEGLALLRALREQRVQTPVVVMTAWGTVDIAVEAMRWGACDFVQKPWGNVQLLETISKHVIANRAARTQLDIAGHVQRKLLGHECPRMATLDSAGRCVPARAVGGDLYDFFDLGVGQAGVLLADVSGKGMGAALLMASLQAAVRSHLSMGYVDAVSLVAAVNRQFWELSPREQFATLFFGQYDERTRCLRYVNAGHESPLLIRASGESEVLCGTASVIGAFASWEGTEGVTHLGPNDTLLIYSDGVVEAGMDRDEPFGVERVHQIVLAHRAVTPNQVLDGLFTALAAHSRGAQHDDQTAVCLMGR